MKQDLANEIIERNNIALAQQGDLTAFERILSSYERQIFTYLFRLVGRREDAEDLTQETFVKVFANLHRFENTRRFSPWLYTIATRTAYDWLRKNRRELLLMDDERMPETLDETDAYIQVENSHDLDLALSKIKAIHKTVLLLFYREELTYEEIATSLSLPLNTVKTHLRRAKVALREALLLENRATQNLENNKRV